MKNKEMKNKRQYYFETLEAYAVWHWSKNAMPLNMEEALQIPHIVKELTDLMNAENERKKQSKSKAGIATSKSEAGILQKQKFVKGAAEWRKNNPEESKKIASKVAKINHANGSYKRNGERLKQQRMQQTPEERTAQSVHANTFITPETRKRIAEQGNKTKEIKRNLKVKNIYDTIQEADWFFLDDALAKYNFAGINNDKPMSLQSISKLFRTLHNYFEYKTVVVTSQSKKQKVTYQKKCYRKRPETDLDFNV